MIIIQDNECRNSVTPSESEVSTPDLINLVCLYINQYAALKRQQITGYVSAQESASWALKMTQAQAYKNGQSAPMIETEAQTRGIAASDLADKVISNATQFQVAEALIAGTAGKHRDAVKALIERQDVASYDWRQGWPF